MTRGRRNFWLTGKRAEGNRRILNPGSIQVRALKHNGLEHRSWPARLLKRAGSLIVVDGVFDRNIEHPLLGTIAGGTVSTEYYWLNRWYNVFRFAAPSANLTSFYCNISEPPRFDGSVLSYIDLDIDVIVGTDFSFRVLDVDEFERNAISYGYSAEVQNNARLALQELIDLINKRAFPFNQ